jgi:hypothetical protein
MASVATNRGALTLARNDVQALTLRVLAVDTAPASDAAARDLNTIADVTADEITGAGYARATLASVTATENDTADAVVITATMPVSIGNPVVGETVVGFWVFQRVGGSDASTDPLICWIDSNNLPTNGATININQADGELLRITTA